LFPEIDNDDEQPPAPTPVDEQTAEDGPIPDADKPDADKPGTSEPGTGEPGTGEPDAEGDTSWPA
jgi:segregation and condensation protein B